MRRELAYLLTFTIMVPGDACGIGLGYIDSRLASTESLGVALESVGAQAEESDNSLREEPQHGTSPPLASSYSGEDTYGPTVYGDTLWLIAARVRPDQSVSIPQVMIALLRANPEAFLQDNINGLKQGLRLHVPDKVAIAAVSRAEAQQEVQRHQHLWEQYRQSLAGSPIPPALGMTPSQPAPGDQTSSRIPEQDQAYLPLVNRAGEDRGSEPPAPAPRKGNGRDSLSQELSLVKEKLEARRRENLELREKLADADELISLLQRQIQVKNRELAALQAQLPQVQRPSPSRQAPSEAGMSPQSKLATPANQGKQTRAPTPVLPALSETVTPETTESTVPSLEASQENLGLEHQGILDRVPGGAIALLGSLILLVLGSVAALVGLRLKGHRKHALAVDEGFSTRAVELTGKARAVIGNAQLMPLDQPSKAEHPAEAVGLTEHPIEPKTPEDLDKDTRQVKELEEDALAELNVYLSYGRFDQAEELVKQAIQANPDQHQYKLRLLEVYYAANLKAAYEDYARVLYEAVSGQGPLWESALAMWQEMSPERRLFEARAQQVAELGAEPSKEFIDITGAGETLAIAAIGAAAAKVYRGGEVNPDLGAEPESGGYSGQDMFDTAASSEAKMEGLGLTAAKIGVEPVDNLSDIAADNDGQGDMAGHTTASKEQDRGNQETEALPLTTFDEAKAKLSEVGSDTSAGHSTDGQGELILDLTDSGIDEEIQKAKQPFQSEPREVGHVTTTNSSIETSKAESLSFGLEHVGKGAQDLLVDIAEQADTVPPEVGSLSIEMDQKSLDKIARSLENPLAQPTAYPISEAGSGTSEPLEMLWINQDLLGWENAIEQSVLTTEQVMADEEIEIKLDLARAYLELGDSEGARSVLNEVVQQGTEQQQQEAWQLLSELK